MVSSNYFYKSNNYIKTKDALLELYRLASENINDLLNDEQTTKVLREEIFPVIKFAEYIGYEEILLCGKLGKSIDAKLRNRNGKIIEVECTTSIKARYGKLFMEYSKQYYNNICYKGPHSKAFEIRDINKADSNDIVYSGSIHKRKFIEQKNLNNEQSIDSCFVDIKKYVEEDIEKIKNKVMKGISRNLYKDFVLILASEHNIYEEELLEYSLLLRSKWENIINNPFSGLFVVNYDARIFKQRNMCEKLNPAYVPMPVIYVKN